jgi:hypothetical protein
MGAPQAAWQVELLDDDPVRHHLVVGLRRHDQLAGRLVGGMIDHRQPLPRAVVPVFAERRAIAVDVVEEPQAVARDAVIRDGERDVLSCCCSGGQRQMQPIAPVIDRHRPSLGRDARHRHPFAILGCGGQIENRFPRAGRDDAKSNRGFAADLVRITRQERETDGIVAGIDPRLSRVGVGTEV